MVSDGLTNLSVSLNYVIQQDGMLRLANSKPPWLSDEAWSAFQSRADVVRADGAMYQMVKNYANDDPCPALYISYEKASELDFDPRQRTRNSLNSRT